MDTVVAGKATTLAWLVVWTGTVKGLVRTVVAREQLNDSMRPDWEIE